MRQHAQFFALFGCVTCLALGQTTLPGTSMDRIGFPTNYQNTFTKMFTFDNIQNRQIRVLWANEIATLASKEGGWNFPYGSIVLFESYSVMEDASGEPLLDANGRFIPNALTTIFVQKKMPGFGSEYGEIRSGEWEFISYTPDGTVSTTPQNSGSCALCHKTGSSLNPQATAFPDIGARWDYVFRPEVFFNRNQNAVVGGTGDPGAVPKGVMQNYSFIPNNIQVTAGQVVTIVNDDQLVHNIVADDGSFNSGYIGTGGAFNIPTTTAGTIPIHCTIHSRMKGTITVKAPSTASK